MFVLSSPATPSVTIRLVTWADAIQNNMLWIQGGMLVVQLLAFCGLWTYVRYTRDLRKAAQNQVKVSQELLRAANDQTEGISRPYITIQAKLRDDSHTILDLEGAVGASVVKDEGGRYVAVNIGNGIALNVSYFFKVRRDCDQPWARKSQSYLQTIQLDQPVALALMINAYSGDHEITFLFQSLGGRWYESVVLIQSKVLTDSRFKQLPEWFQPSASYSP
jgi:hypothetical protein